MKATSTARAHPLSSNRIGQRVAAESVTVVDDGTIENRRGSLTVDDEGTPTESTTLIERGILKAYMQDKLNARVDGHEAHRQRAAGILCPPAHAENDQHLYAGGRA